MPKQNVPALRLHGFSGEWKTASIGAVSALHNGRDYKHLGEGCIPVYGTGGYMAAVDQALSHDKDAVGIGRKGTINKPYILKAPFWTVDTLFYVVPNQDTDLAFFYASVLRVDWMAKNTATGLPSLTSQAINSADISVPPTLEEQQAIGAIFTNLDAAINQHTLKHKSLQQSKTALMQRMFPQEGQTVPELRLEGFSGEWGTVSLDELQKRRLVTLGRGEVISQIDINAHPGNYPIYSSSAKNDGLFGRYGRYMFSDERITWSIDGGGQFFYRPAHRYSVTNVCGWMKINTNTIDTSFLYLALYLQWLEQSFDYSAKAHPSNIVQIYNPHFPPTLEEQQAIGAVFTNLDQLIAAEAQYIASLKQAKTALLQRMFI